MSDKPLTSARTFQEVFETYKPRHSGMPKPESDNGYTLTWKTTDALEDKRVKVKVGGLCSIDRITPEGRQYMPSLYALPNERTFSAVCNNTIPLDRDSIYFSIIIREDGTAWVYYQHNLIIGSGLVAIIDASTIPEVKP